jgi:hypothetical protein
MVWDGGMRPGLDKTLYNRFIRNASSSVDGAIE